MGGSWYMHGDGGSAVGGRLDNLGIDLEFYFIYRMMLKNFVHDDVLRSELVLEHCKQMPAEYFPSDGPFVSPAGERLCHLFWARNFKLAMTDKANYANPEDACKIEGLLAGVPPRDLSIAGFVLVTLRAVFHSKFPEGDTIYTQLTDKILEALVGTSPTRSRKC